MEILENLELWQTEYEQGWLAHYRKTGEMDFKNLYNRPKNKTAPAGPAVDLTKSRLLFISSAGGYLRDSQEPFSINRADLGDYTIRQFPSSTPLEALAFSHVAYDHTAIEEDPQVLLPLRHLEDMANEGIIGELAASVISFCGWLPDVVRTINELTPAVVQAAKTEEVEAALLVPA